MRVAILLLGIFGGMAAVGGGAWYFVIYGVNHLAYDNSINSETVSAIKRTEFKDMAIASFQAFPFFFAGAFLGLVGGIMAIMGNTRSGGILMLVAALVPPIFTFDSPLVTEPVMYGSLSLFVIGGILGLVTGKKKEVPEDEEDEDD